MLKTIAVIVVIAIAIVLVLAAMKPDTFRVARSTSIKAPPEKIFALINDFHQFNTWNPYAKKDPAYKGVYSGPAAGVGAKHAWESKEVGVGSMEIIESTPPSKVKLKLDFVKPFEAHNIVDFDIVPKGDATDVSWSMQGETPLMAKIVHVFLDMDSIVGKDFEDGLAALKTLAES